MKGKYKTFWRRLIALIIDAYAMWPIGILLGYFLNKNGLVFVLMDSLSLFVYSIIFHGLCGQTLGKFILKIKVLTISETKISFKNSFIRDAIPLFLAFLLITYMYYYFPEFSLLVNNDNLSEQQVASLFSNNDILGKLHIYSPIGILLLLSLGWYVLEILTVLTDYKRRALHDLIADTVVVKKVPNKGISKDPYSGTNHNPDAQVRVSNVSK